MANIKPTNPSFTFGYWRPWNEHSDIFDSYNNYRRDIDLQKLNADVIGNYINQANESQIAVLNHIADELGYKLNSISKELEIVNENLNYLNDSIDKVNNNLDILIEQQRITNLLLLDISKELKIPDSEKERLFYIEEGLKYFTYARKNKEFYIDAYNHFKKALDINKNDSFVLHKLGLMHLYVDEFLNPLEAFEYFKSAIKYSLFEYENISDNDYNFSDKYSTSFLFECCEILLESQSVSASLLQRKLKLGYNESGRLVDTLEVLGIVSSFNGVEARKLLINNKNEINKTINRRDLIFKELEDNKKFKEKIYLLLLDSLDKISFNSYILGKFDLAVEYKTTYINLKHSKEFIYNFDNVFKYFEMYPSEKEENILDYIQLLKFKIRNNENIEQEIKLFHNDLLENSKIFGKILSELEFQENEFSKKLINNFFEYNKKKLSQIKLFLKENTSTNYYLNLIKDIEELPFFKRKKAINNLSDLIKNDYDIRKRIISGIDEMENEILKFPLYTNHKTLKEKLLSNHYKWNELSTNKIKEIYFEKLKLIFDNKVKIGDFYEGGIVFYIDYKKREVYVHATNFELNKYQLHLKKDLINTPKNIGTGYDNTKKLARNNSNFFSFSMKSKSAAVICSSLKYNGFNDWFLPSLNESKEILKTWKLINEKNLFLKNNKNDNYLNRLIKNDSIEIKDLIGNDTIEKRYELPYPYDLTRNNEFEQGDLNDHLDNDFFYKEDEEDFDWEYNFRNENYINRFIDDSELIPLLEMDYLIEFTEEKINLFNDTNHNKSESVYFWTSTSQKFFNYNFSLNGEIFKSKYIGLYDSLIEQKNYILPIRKVKF